MLSPIQDLPLRWTPAFRVNSEDPKADNGDVAWNYLFQNITDISKDACFERHGAGHEVAALEDWGQQMAGLDTEDKRLEFKKFSLDLYWHTCVKLREKETAEDEDFEADALLEKLQEGGKRSSSAQDRFESKKAKGAEIAAGLPPVRISGSDGPYLSGTGFCGGRSTGLKEIWDADGRCFYSDQKTNCVGTVTRNLPIARSMARTRFDKGLDYSGLGWELSRYLEFLEQQIQRQQLEVYVSRGDPYYGCTIFYNVAHLPAVKDKDILEKLLRWEWNVGSMDLCYLHFLPLGLASAKLEDPYVHLQALKAIKQILWIFFGAPWEFCLAPMIARFEIDLMYYTRPSSSRDEHLWLTDMIHTSFGLAGVMMRDRETRGSFLAHGEESAIASNVEDVEDFFKVNVLSALNSQTTSQALTSYRESGRLAAFKGRIEPLLLKSAGKKSGELGVRKEITPTKDKDGESFVKLLCVKNLNRQWDFDHMPANWKTCTGTCSFEHVAVGTLTKPAFDAALLKCDKIFGSDWSKGGWSETLASAFKTKDGGRMRAVFRPNGDPMPPKNNAGGNAGRASKGGGSASKGSGRATGGGGAVSNTDA